MLTKYKPSGVFTPKFFAGAPLVLVGAAVLGAVYQLLMHWIPLIILEVLLVFGMCIATVFIIRMLTRATRCRNPALGTVMGLAAGIVAVAVGHYVEYRLWRPQILAQVPADKRADADAALDFPLYCEIRADAGWTIGRAGSSSSSSPTVSGVFVYIFWGAEALVLIGAATIGGRSAASEPYCESCGKWADQHMLSLEVPEPSDETLAGIRSATTMATLIPHPAAMVAPPPPPVPDDPKLAKKQAKAPKTVALVRYMVTSCPQCKMLHTLKVEHEVYKTARGKTEKRSKVLHDKVVMTSEEVGLLAALKDQSAGVPA